MADYPLPDFHFQVKWGTARLSFTEVSGLDTETHGVDYQSGENKKYHRMEMPGMQKFSNITLKRGTYIGDNSFRQWYEAISSNRIKRRDITITLFNENHIPTLVWKVLNAWPVKIQATDLKAEGNEMAIETMELAHEGLTIEFR